jgi:hypothetical protein
MKALQVFAGPRAREYLRQHGLRPGDVRVIPAAAGGPKGLVLLPLDRYLFGHWLASSPQTVHLLGASIGAWRMAAACLPNADVALAQLGEDYITQSYPHEPGHMPTARTVSALFGERLEQRLGARAAEVLAHPQRRLHVFTSRGRKLLHRPGRLAMPLGWAGAFAANALGRQSLGGWMQRVVFSDPRDALPVPLADYPTHSAALTPQNLAQAVLASCTIPFALEAVQDVSGAPKGTYWDGGITDYHLHLNYSAMTPNRDPNGASGGATGGAGLVLYPHFISHVVPGWLDKSWKRRHRATPALDNLVLLAPHPDWVRALPGGKLPDRADFKRHADDEAGRQRVWRQTLHESQRLADEFAQSVGIGQPIEALPLP